MTTRNPLLMSMPICKDAEKNTIPKTDNGTTGKFSEQYGWQSINSLPLGAGGKAVERLDFNGVLGLLGGIDYMTQRGYTFEWDSNLPYVVGCIVIDTTDGKTYRCVNDVPAGGSAPSLDSVNWKPYDIADYVGGVTRLTNYNIGATATMLGIPAGFYLETLTGGTTGANEPTLPPIIADTTFSDGTVTWIIRKCMSTNGGYMTGDSIKRNTNNSLMSINGGDSYRNGGTMQAYGKDHPTNPGEIFIEASDGTTYSSVKVLPNGKCYHVRKGYNDTDLGASGVVSSNIGTSGYVKREDGLIVQWGDINATTTGADVVFPVSYVGNPKVMACASGGDASANLVISATSNTGCTIMGSRGIYSYWFAIGY